MRTRHHSWEWHLPGTPAQLWPMLADTDRFDRDTGVPPVERLSTPEELLHGGRVLARVRQLGIPLDYEQLPFEWDEPHRFSVERRFTTGPLASLRIDARLTPEGEGTHLSYDVWTTPANVLGAIAVPVQIGVVLARAFDRTFRAYAELATVGDVERSTGRRRRSRPAAADRLRAATGAMRQVGVDPALVDRLADLVVDGDDVVVARLRPYELADRWGQRRGDVLDAMLEATRAGLLRFRWDVLCPRCRIAKATVDSLGALPGDVHCDTCLIEWGTDLAAAVELTFRPTEEVRPVRSVEHCIGGPLATPHVVAQARVEAGATQVVRDGIDAGDHLLRLHVGAVVHEVAVRAHAGGLLDALVAVGDEEVDVAPGGSLAVAAPAAAEVLAALERPRWGSDAVTGSEVLARQRFRDLFATEALRPGEELDVGVVTIAFTDLCGSTALYRTIGDAAAFGRVRSHFDVLHDAIAHEGGAIVKTIGDAVMAVFVSPAPAVRALLAAEEALAAVDGPGGPLHLKASLHRGTALAVTLNDRVDYFGTTVNLAARLEGLAGPDQLVLSADAVDEEVASVLGRRLAGEPEVVDDLRGLEGRSVQVHRISMAPHAP